MFYSTITWNQLYYHYYLCANSKGHYMSLQQLRILLKVETEYKKSLSIM